MTVYETARLKATLLCVDDEESILQSLKRLFIPLGYEVLLANSGEAGLKILENYSVDVIICDTRMSEMAGTKFFKIAYERFPTVKRILFNGLR